MTAIPPPDHEASVAGVRAYFDLFADGEWERLDSSPAGRISVEVHRRFLRDHIRPGMRVLEVGAGPGRFTIELGALGASVVVTDLSPVQLSLNERHVAAAGLGAAVERRELADVCSLSGFADAEFDAVVAYGGPLSYAFDRAPAAMAELLRVVPAGAPVVASVMSTLGSYRQFLRGVVEVVEQFGHDVNDELLRTGDLRPVQPPGQGHSCRMFRWSDIVELVTACGAQVLGGSASNWASLGDPETVEQLASDPTGWQRFVENEVRLCAEPGVRDGGTHILFAAARPAQQPR